MTTEKERQAALTDALLSLSYVITLAFGERLTQKFVC